jgi:hypothetical protein
LPQTWPKDDVQAVEKSVAHAEYTATTGQPDPGIKNVFKLGAVDAAHKIAVEAQSHLQIVAGAVATSAAAAMYAAYSVPVTRHSYSAAHQAEFATSRLDLPISIAAIIRRDFDHLRNLSEWRHWTDDTPIPPEVFGPPWPEGPPQGWPPTIDLPRRSGVSLAFVARDQATDQMIEDDVINLYDAINRYHIARGGVPLTYEDLRSLCPALIPAEV